MSITGLAIIPTPPSSTASPSAGIVSRLSQAYPAETHEEYHVEHRLFVNTSSLLPGAAPQQRHYTQLLTTSHDPENTYVTAVVPSASGSSMITIPSASQDAFTQLVVSKLQPQWAYRQSLLLDGIAMSLPSTDEGKWVISLGDLRVASRAGRAGAGGLRGILVELQHFLPKGITTPSRASGDLTAYEAVFRQKLQSAVAASGEHSIDEIKIKLRRTSEDRREASTSENKEPVLDRGMAIADLYMELLRSSRA